MNPVEIYVIAKDSGLLLHKYAIVNLGDERQDELLSGFLVALNNFAQEVRFPAGVSLIRSGSLEARFSAGTYVFSVLIIDFEIPLGSSTESVLSGLASEVVERFEADYKEVLEQQFKTQIFDPDKFADFGRVVDSIIDKFGREATELYQKLVLIEGMYAKVPQKWCLPLIERVSQDDPVDVVAEIPKKYHRLLKQAVLKVNRESKPVWDIFVVSLVDPEDL